MKRSRISLLIFVFFLLSKTTNGQIGIQVGLNLSNLTTTGPSNPFLLTEKNNLGFHVGVTRALPLLSINKHLFCEVGINLVSKISPHRIFALNQNAFRNHLFAEFPVLIKYEIHLEDLDFVVKVGPTISSAAPSKALDISADFTDYKKLNLGFHFALGIRFGRFQYDLFYNLTRVKLTDTIPPDFDSIYASGAGGIMVSYVFR